LGGEKKIKETKTSGLEPQGAWHQDPICWKNSLLLVSSGECSNIPPSSLFLEECGYAEEKLDEIFLQEISFKFQVYSVSNMEFQCLNVNFL
jgi:hypothetical protein